MFRASLTLDAAARLPRERGFAFHSPLVSTYFVAFLYSLLMLHVHAAVYGDYLTGDVGCFVACKECHGFGDVLGISYAL